MIFDTVQEKEVQKVGDIKNNNVSIDTSNIDFIVTILSTNLYSKPIESFIRETVSNAWDSHIEAGVDEPVILELGVDTENNYYCRIQDFGVGLSPERFNDIYRNIGSSTKRADNTQIGGFGIGRFSALAYSDVVHITSVYEGKKYLYMMYKDGNSISIDLLNEVDTEERNGVEVKLEVKPGDFNNFATAIKSQLVYFENLYIIDTTKENPTGLFTNNIDIQEDYNNFQIKKYDNFWVNTLDNSKRINLILGKVRYPLRIESLNKIYSNKIADYPISLVFEIGDLAVTPNREEILYSDKNIKTIEDKLDKAIEEVDGLIALEKNKDYTKMSDYLEAISNKQYLTLLKTDYDEVKISMTDSKRTITLNGEFYEPKLFEATYETIMHYNKITSDYILSNNQIQYKRYQLSLRKLKSSFERIYIADLGNVKNITKRYIRENFENRSYFIKDDKPFRWYVKEYIKRVKEVANEKNYYANGVTKNLTRYDSRIFKAIMEYIIGNLKKTQRFNDSKVPSKWISDTKAADKLKRGAIKKQGFDWKQKINLHVIREKDYGGGLMTDSVAMEMVDISTKYKKLTVYAEKGNEKIRLLFNYFKPEARPNLVEVASTKIKLLKNVDNFIHVKKFINVKQKLIRNIGTVEYLKKEFPLLEQIASIKNLDLISERLYNVVQELYTFVDKYKYNGGHMGEADKTLVKEIYELCEEKDYFNEEIRGLFNKHKEELLNASILIDLCDSSLYSSRKAIPSERINLTVDYLLARKLIRPSVKAVLKLKKETIFNLKSKEDENNEN